MPRTLLPTLLTGPLVAAALALESAPAAGQPVPPAAAEEGANWTLPAALGFGGLGFGAGLAMAWGMEGDDFGPPPSAIVLIGAATVGGIVGGALIGDRAEDAVAAGRPVAGAHRAAVIVGTVTAGATLGALAAVPLINREGEGTPLGSDERTVLLTTLAGAGLGALYAWRNADELSPRGVAAAPAVSRDGGVGIALRTRF